MNPLSELNRVHGILVMLSDHARGEWYGKLVLAHQVEDAADAPGAEQLLPPLLEAIEAVERTILVWSSLNPPSGDDQRGRP